MIVHVGHYDDEIRFYNERSACIFSIPIPTTTNDDKDDHDDNNYNIVKILDCHYQKNDENRFQLILLFANQKEPKSIMHKWDIPISMLTKKVEQKQLSDIQSI